jgi:hypothetical protein
MARDVLNRLSLVRVRKVRVALDHLQALPAAQLLDGPQVHPCHDEPGGEGVPQRVRCDRRQTGFVAGLVELLQRLPVRLREDVLPLAVGLELLQGRVQFRVERDRPALLILGVGRFHRQALPLQVHVLPAERQSL